MIKNYLKVAWRNLTRNKTHSLINIVGLSVGMAVAMLIGLWIWDELSFNTTHKNYDTIARVMQNSKGSNGDIGTQSNLPFIMGDALRAKYGSDFKHVVMSTNTDNHVLTYGDKKLKQYGNYMEPGAPEMLSLKMLNGSYSGLKDAASILLSQSAAKAIFGNADPMNKLMKIDNRLNVKVTGVYANLPNNSEFKDVAFIAPFELYLQSAPWVRTQTDPWGWNAWYCYVQMAGNADMNKISQEIKDIKQNASSPEGKNYHWQIFLDPMKNWHLYAEFKNGVRTGGLIEFVWLFGIIGSFVLLLACINFMNLSTARSEKRAKEVGIRKAIGSVRGQLIKQFFSESLMVVFFAFLFSLVLVQLALPAFNMVAGKTIVILWDSPVFWLSGICFTLFTGIIAGSYPAFYLSSFKPIKVLKGTFKVGRFAALPRKVLVVVQFTVSVVLIIGTTVVLRQIQFAKNRPAGYNRNGLVMVQMLTKDIHQNFSAVRTELQNAGAIVEMAETQAPVTEVWSTNGNIAWKGKDPTQVVDFPNTAVSVDYGKTAGWKFVDGRDFSRDFQTDTAAFVINETAVKFMHLKNPVGETISWGGLPFKVIGVVKDVITESPYEPIAASLYHLSTYPNNFILLRLNPSKSTHQSIEKVAAVFNKYNPSIPFDYKFADDEYAKKFGDEERIGKLASCFAGLAIFISCLGLFGMASFMAEQRVKEIGVRKVLGATVFNLWQLLSKDFVVMVIISLLIASPVAYYFMHKWLLNYQYHTEITWWIFLAAAAGALVITLLTVSYQGIKAALANPVRSLRSE
ncbi:MAG: ABC transporter permease [Bacteroidota bacterium]